MSKTDKAFFPALTGYRAIAAWMIFVYHFTPFANPKYPNWIKQIIWEFHIGVDMFFVLSGFLITYRYFNDYPIHFKKYMVNRIARIYPMYFLVTAAVFLVWFFQKRTWNSEKTIEAILSFTMTKAMFAKYSLSGIPQGWTLTLEELFYLTAPLYFILIRKKTWWLFVLPVLIFIFGTSLKTMFAGIENAGGFMQKNISVYIIEFFAGIALALFIMRKKLTTKFPVATYGGLFFIGVYLIGMHYLREPLGLKRNIGTFISMAYLSILGIAPLLWGLINEKTLIRSFLGSKYMVLLGKASYIFYLIHKGFLPIWINDYISDNKLVIFILLNVISVILFLYIEEPSNHYIRKKFGKPTPKTVTA